MDPVVIQIQKVEAQLKEEKTELYELTQDENVKRYVYLNYHIELLECRLKALQRKARRC